MIRIVIGKGAVGEFHVDLKEKKVIRTIVNNENNFSINFPLIEKAGYNYKTLEKIMKYYMMEDIPLEDIVEKIRENGFFYPVKPSLFIYIVESDE